MFGVLGSEEVGAESVLPGLSERANGFLGAVGENPEAPRGGVKADLLEDASELAVVARHRQILQFA